MKTRFFNTLLFAVVSFAFVTVAIAQEPTPETKPQDNQRPNAGQPKDIRQNVLMQLGLSREQVQQIRRLNQERKPLMDEAQRRVREANMALDMAIYSDQTSDADVEARIKDVQLAQAEVAKLRFANEYAVRKVLTPEQLVRFRELRRRFEQIRREMETRRPMNETRNGNGRQPTPGNDQPVRRFIKQNQPKPN